MSMTIILFVVAVFLLGVVLYYNKFVVAVNRAKEAWADIDVQLKRRYDLIPNLVNTVKGFATQEKDVFESVTKARAAAMSATSPEAKGEAEMSLTSTLKSLFAVSEAYPQLKSDQNFLRLQEELSDTENKIMSARRFYNGNVRDLNSSIEMFPGNIIAGIFGFKKIEFFELSEDSKEKENVEIKF